MLFNSYVFLLSFLPIALFVFFGVGKLKWQLALVWLTLVSLFFYAWWSPKYLFLILGSMTINYFLGINIQSNKQKNTPCAKRWLIVGVFFNLGLIIFYKYSNFLISSVNWSFNQSYPKLQIMLPLAISFFTFQQIAYLVDIYKNKAKTPSCLQYFLFITFFPQLIAGPIVHHDEMIPQFKNKKIFIFSQKNLAIGLTIFFIGLFKKVAIADQIAPVANQVFDFAKINEIPTFWEAWAGVLAYSFQLYFDFSGYSDMAIGLARLFNISLPTNFNSPYQAVNIIDFWRRWHITLSTFLRHYLYIPLGGNKKGTFRQYQNLIITMLLGGLWHGAGINFLFWGGLHGLYLSMNHLWKKTHMRYRMARLKYYQFFSQILTFIAVASAWVLFRASDISTAKRLYHAMFGLNGIELPQRFKDYAQYIEFFNYVGMFHHQLFNGPRIYSLLIGLFIMTYFCPNTIVFMKKYSPALGFNHEEAISRIKVYWRPTWVWAIFQVILSIICLTLLSQPSEFLYYQF